MVSIKKVSLPNLFASWLGKEIESMQIYSVATRIKSFYEVAARKIVSSESGLHERVRTEGVIFYVIL